MWTTQTMRKKSPMKTVAVVVEGDVDVGVGDEAAGADAGAG